MTLRVALNLLWCVPGEVGGSEEYLTRQIIGLGRVDPGRHRAVPTVFALAGYPGAHPELAGGLDVRVARVSGRRRWMRIATEHTWLAAQTARGRFDVVHHGGGTTPRTGAGPVVLTVHDLQYLRFPEYVSAAKLRYLRTVVPRSVARAAVTAVPSEYVRGTVTDAFGVDPERVVVVPHGIDVPSMAPSVDESAIRHRFGLGEGPVLVYPAITHPHKNHRLLLETMHRHWSDPDLRLVLLGGRGAAEQDVERSIVELGLADRVVRPGRVPDGDRDALLAIAEALVFPSTYEGFGAPLIEAMAVGAPVICGDHPTLREVVGDAGVVLPDDPDAWGPALVAVRRSRSELVAAGRARAERFSLEASGAALLDAYERAAAR